MAYDTLQKTYISKYYWRNPSMVKFIDLINSTSQGLIRRLSIYTFHAFKSRSELLYRET